jgi:PIN domain nuclease of toxin-antitoxin system
VERAEVRLLFDTHALLWWWTDDARLSVAARALIADERNEVLASAASAWEIGIKHRLGKLPEAQDVIFRYHELIEADGFLHLPISHVHALKASQFESTHRDLFDRMLAAQAFCESATLITCDELLTEFPITRIW